MRYSQRLEAETPTRFWVNNPTPTEARRALEIGNVVGVASNGNFVQRMLTAADSRDEAIAFVDEHVATVADDALIVALTAQHFLGQYCELYRPLFEESDGRLGWVAIQGDPFHDENYDFMVAEAERFYAVAPNIRVKFPATPQASFALEEWTRRGRATLATCGFSVPYLRDAIAAYARGAAASAHTVPELFATTLAGPFSEFLGKYVDANEVDIAPEVLRLAGSELAKTQYAVHGGAAGVTVLGGCRELDHFTEMVPGAMHVTVNYDFIEKLNDADPALEPRVDRHLDAATLAELSDKLPPFRYAIGADDGLYPHWSEHPAARYFRNYVRNGWAGARGIVRERRILAG